MPANSVTTGDMLQTQLLHPTGISDPLQIGRMKCSMLLGSIEMMDQNTCAAN